MTYQAPKEVNFFLINLLNRAITSAGDETAAPTSNLEHLGGSMLPCRQGGREWVWSQDLLGGLRLDSIPVGIGG